MENQRFPTDAFSASQVAYCFCFFWGIHSSIIAVEERRHYEANNAATRRNRLPLISWPYPTETRSSTIFSIPILIDFFFLQEGEKLWILLTSRKYFQLLEWSRRITLRAAPILPTHSRSVTPTRYIKPRTIFIVSIQFKVNPGQHEEKKTLKIIYKFN